MSDNTFTGFKQLDDDEPAVAATNSGKTNAVVSPENTEKSAATFPGFSQSIEEDNLPKEKNSDSQYDQKSIDELDKTILGGVGGISGSVGVYKGINAPKFSSVINRLSTIGKMPPVDAIPPVVLPENTGNLPIAAVPMPDKGSLPVSRDSSARYINSQLPDENEISRTQLQELTKSPVLNNNSDIQGAIAKLSGQQATRTFKVNSIDPVTGMKKGTWTTTPNTEPADLSPYPNKGTGMYAGVGTPERQIASDAWYNYLRNNNAIAQQNAELQKSPILQPTESQTTRANAIRGATNVATSGLGAANTLTGAYDTARSIQDNNGNWYNPDTILKGVGTVGSALSAVPARALPVVGNAIATTADAVNYARTHPDISDPRLWTKGAAAAGVAGAPFTGGLSLWAAAPEAAYQVSDAAQRAYHALPAAGKLISNSAGQAGQAVRDWLVPKNKP